MERTRGWSGTGGQVERGVTWGDSGESGGEGCCWWIEEMRMGWWADAEDGECLTGDGKRRIGAGFMQTSGIGVRKGE